jgi:hypothetical protein
MLGHEFHRLVLDNGPNGAIDLKYRWEETQRWFSGMPVYTELKRITYPPEAYVLIWPALGWLPLTAARFLFAATVIAMLAWLAHLIVAGSGASTTTERLFIVLVMLSMKGVAIAIGNGQFVLHLLAPTLAALLLLHDQRVTWGRDLSIALLLLVALMKPTVTLPLVLMGAIASRRLRPLTLTVVLYVLVTLWAASFQPVSLVELTRQWLSQSAAFLGGGYGDIQDMLLALGEARWAQPAALIVLTAASLWAWRHRDADLWIIIGVGAIVSRLWTYHRPYDDALILLPLVALFRIAKSGPPQAIDYRLAVALFATTVIVMRGDARLEGAAPQLAALLVCLRIAVWLAMLVYLLRMASRPRAAMEALG